MSQWECGVCGYIHSDENPPEKCPVCDAPEKMFSLKKEQETSAPQGTDVKEAAVVSDKKTEAEVSDGGVKKWRCTVCGYIHTGDAPPEKCPVCHAPAEKFELLVEKNQIEEAAGPRSRCSVCGYTHKGDEPPETCPVCSAPQTMFVEIDAKGRPLGEEPVEEPDEEVTPVKKSLGSRFADLVLDLHLHPITVHFPNGILPAVVVFLVLSVYLDIIRLETAAWYNMIAVLIMLPPVLVTGYMEWQKRYRGAKTPLFIVKIFCAILVLGSVNILVFWRLLDPGVLAPESAYRNIYLGIAGLMLASAGIAGHLGGKLVFGTRK